MSILIKKQSAFFKQILESIEDYAVFTTDCDGNISSWNKGAENVLGYSEEEILGSPAHVIFTEQDIIEDAPEHEAAEALISLFQLAIVLIQ